MADVESTFLPLRHQVLKGSGAANTRVMLYVTWNPNSGEWRIQGSTHPFRTPELGFSIHQPIHVLHHINKMTDKNHRVVSIDAGKTFDKTQPALTTSTLSRTGAEGTDRNVTNPQPVSYSESREP